MRLSLARGAPGESGAKFSPWPTRNARPNITIWRRCVTLIAGFATVPTSCRSTTRVIRGCLVCAAWPHRRFAALGNAVTGAPTYPAISRDFKASGTEAATGREGLSPGAQASTSPQCTATVKGCECGGIARHQQLHSFSYCIRKASSTPAREHTAGRVDNTGQATKGHS